MILKVEDPQGFIAMQRTDHPNPRVKDGETFEVSDPHGRYLLSHFYPRVTPAEPVSVE